MQHTTVTLCLFFCLPVVSAGNSGSLEEEQVILTTKPSLQLLFHNFLDFIYYLCWFFFSVRMSDLGVIVVSCHVAAGN